MTLSLNIPVTGLAVPYSFSLLYSLIFHSVFTQLGLKSDTDFQTTRAMTQNPIQGQVGWSFEQPGLVEVVPVHGKWIGTRWSIRSLPIQISMWFY